MKFLLSKHAVVSIWLAMGLALVPVYLWESGGMQLSHVLLAVGFVAILTLRGFRLDLPGILLTVLSFMMVLRDGYSAIHYASFELVTPVFYGLFTWLAFVSMKTWLDDARSARFLWLGLVAAEVVAVAGVLYFGYGATIGSDGAWRSVGTFNNPNQLGYFSVCMLSLVGLLYLRGVIGRLVLGCMLAGVVFLAVASLSKAAMLACAAGVMAIAFSLGWKRSRVVIGLVMVVAMAVALVVQYDSGALGDYKFVKRLQDIGTQEDDSMAERGYSVLLDADASEFLMGFGSEGVRTIVGHELHSTVASYFANFGFLTGFLFVFFLLIWGRRLFYRDGFVGVMVAVFPPMLYGLTHNGSRFTIFWVLLALSMSGGGRGGRGGQAVLPDFRSFAQRGKK